MKITKFIKRNLKLITIISVMIIISILILCKYYLLQQKSPVQEQILITKEQPEEIEETKEIEEIIFVDIKGEVLKPGVYQIENTKKVIDVIHLAGGFTEQADSSLINLAKKVTNEMVIIIYSKEEVKKALQEDKINKIVDNKCICPEIKNDACLNNNNSTSENNTNTTTSTNNNNNSDKKIVNINTATLEELQTLTGIGEAKAKTIIEYREKVGSFKRIEELMEVKGIGEALYEKIKTHITV